MKSFTPLFFKDILKRQMNYNRTKLNREYAILLPNAHTR